MIHSKHKVQTTPPEHIEGSSGINLAHIRDGFTLLETLFAAVIIALVMGPLFFMQGEMLQRVARVSRHMQRIFFMQDFLFDVHKQPKKDTNQLTLEKQLDNPPTVLRYQLNPVDTKSALHAIKGLHSERVTAVWSVFNKRYDDALVSLRCIKPEQQP